MVRFKVRTSLWYSQSVLTCPDGLMSFCLVQNRWLLVEFIFPSSQPVPAALALPSGSSSAGGSAQDASDASSKAKGKRRSNGQSSSKRKKKSKSTTSPDVSSSDEDDSEQSDLDDPPPFLGSSHPLLLPPPPTSAGQTRVLGEKQIHAAVKASVVQAFGDDGWAKIASNTNGTPPLPFSPSLSPSFSRGGLSSSSTCC